MGKRAMPRKRMADCPRTPCPNRDRGFSIVLTFSGAFPSKPDPVLRLDLSAAGGHRPPFCDAVNKFWYIHICVNLAA